MTYSLSKSIYHIECLIERIYKSLIENVSMNDENIIGIQSMLQ
jgi:hypothetical protein